MAAGVAVCHLVRAGNPPGWLERFLETYATRDAGEAHRFVAILKGFDDTAAVRAQISARVRSAEFLEIGDEGFDITAYRHAAGAVDDGFVCFLNSHAAIEAEGWLSILLSAFSSDGKAGVAAATASWERADAAMFPNAHVRTNGFLMRREVFAGLDFGPLATKRDSNRFEGGLRSLTRQLVERDLVPYVAGRDGGVFGAGDWPESATFRWGEQENLLISDNRTRDYAASSYRRRLKLARLAWGDRAVVPVRNVLERVQSWIA